MKLALLKGNRFNPWHLRAFAEMAPAIETTAFRAESEIQQYFAERDDPAVRFNAERIYFEHEIGGAAARLVHRVRQRLGAPPPRIAPFHDRLEGFDIIQTWELFTDWTEQALDAKKRFGIPVSVMVWDNIPFNHDDDPLRARIKRRAADEADVFLVHTDRSRRTLHLEGIDDARIIQFNPGVDLERFAPGPANRAALQRADDEFVVLFVGWLLPRKGIDWLLFALRLLCDDPDLRDVRFRLVAVGSGPGKDRVDQVVARTGLADRCTFAGSQPYTAMAEFYRAADVFVLPSIAVPGWQEQFGMSLIEAMACGRPVVTTWSGAIPEIAGDAAQCVQPDDFLSLYEAIKAFALDPSMRAEYGQRARSRAEERFGLTAMTDALRRVYHGMCAQ